MNADFLVDHEPTSDPNRHVIRALLKIEGTAFQTSAVIIAEAIKALQVARQVAQNDVAPPAISSAVAGPIAQAAWERTGAWAERQVSDEHKVAVLVSFPHPQAALLVEDGLGPFQAPQIPSVRPAVIIGEFGAP